MKRQTEIFSIFGEIETVVAEAMIKEGGCFRIEAWDIPLTARYNSKGVIAKFAIVIPAALVQAFENRIVELRR
jgi:hypothetical protein